MQDLERQARLNRLRVPRRRTPVRPVLNESGQRSGKLINCRLPPKYHGLNRSFGHECRP